MANYNKLAALMGDHQDLAMFRRFQKLNMKSLLGMQAEILHLESELAEIEREDVRSGEKSRSLLHESVFNLKESHGSPHDTQWSKVLEVREKLEQYSKLGATSSPWSADTKTFGSKDKALVLYSRVQALPDPCDRDLHTLQEWLDRPEGGDFFLRGREADTWNDEHDVLALSSRQANRDSVTALVNDRIIPWYHCLRSRWDKPNRKTCGNHGVHYSLLVDPVLHHKS
ncbi:MAG: hypothetical protein Q9169_005959 [Polycauliona sp. 2 TL-2023]